MAKYMDQSGAQHFAEALMSATKTINGQTIWGDGDMQIGGSAKQPVYIEDFSKVWESTNLNTAAVGEIIPIVGDNSTKNLPTVCASMPASFSWAGYYVLLTEENIDSSGKNCLFVINTYLNSEMFDPANIYAYCFSTKNTTGGFDNSRWVAIPSAQDQVIEVPYFGFKTAINNNNLIPGRMYKINDYKPVPKSGMAKQDPNASPGDYTTSLFVRAITSNIYDENALLVDSTLNEIQEMYEVKYTIENAGFIDPDRGKGTITYMRDFATNNIAYWDWRPHYGIVAPDAESTTFTVCKNCHISSYTGDVQKMVPYMLSHCNDVTIGRVSSSIYLQYVDNCIIGDFCTNVHMGIPLATRKVQHTVIGNNCKNIMILPTSSGSAYYNVIGNGCSSVQFAGSYNVIGNNCKNIYLTRNDGSTIQSSDYVSVGDNCVNIGRNSEFTTFSSLQVNYIGFYDVVIGDLCRNIYVANTSVAPAWTCTFGNCEFQKIGAMTLSAGDTTTDYTIIDKVFRFVNAQKSYPFNISASNPSNWKTLVGEISYNSSTHKFAFRSAIGTVWTNIA